METSELKTNFHSLINKIQDAQMLAHFYSIMVNISNSENGRLWERLSKTEQEELMEAELESSDETLLITNDEMKRKHSKWL